MEEIFHFMILLSLSNEVLHEVLKESLYKPREVFHSKVNFQQESTG